MSLICIIGPTASGKSVVAVELGKIVSGEVVSCDSMQIYRKMNIGTAKITEDEMQGIPHHMIDIVEPNEKYSVASFKKDASCAIDDIKKRGKTPILAGGTGLYISALIDNIEYAKAENDFSYRNELEKIYVEKGGEFLFRMLAEIDPQSALKLHPNDKKRVIRALEIYKTTGHTMTEHIKNSKNNPPLFEAKMFGLLLNRKTLYDRINTRVDKMFADGLINEVSKLINDGLNTSHTAIQGLGYKEVYEYLKGNIDYDTLIETIKMQTRRYAKRQCTWFNRDERINWIDVEKFSDGKEIALYISQFLSEEE